MKSYNARYQCRSSSAFTEDFGGSRLLMQFTMSCKSIFLHSKNHGKFDIRAHCKLQVGGLTAKVVSYLINPCQSCFSFYFVVNFGRRYPARLWNLWNEGNSFVLNAFTICSLFPSLVTHSSSNSTFKTWKKASSRILLGCRCCRASILTWKVAIFIAP